jgi:ubiquinone/menaquinone biosynthesis C-methylase UbiE/intracellular sulfur oxidation DsrE/DsrF family protein
MRLSSHHMLALVLMSLVAHSNAVLAQEKSVKPGINDSFRDPDPKQFTERFEIESREVFAQREAILKAIKLKPTDVVADIGAGTGLFTRLFATNLGPEGRVIAVDIAQKFLDHIEVSCRERNIRNVETLLCKDDSTELPPESVDVAYICDTYHHFEFPIKTMTSLRKAMKPGGRVIVVDFKRIEGESTEWTINHVRAGQEVFEKEIIEAGFRKVDEVKDLLKENYMVVFEVDNKEQASTDPHRGGPGRGRGRGMGRGMGRGPDAAMRADQDVFHYLLDRHAAIRRDVKLLDNGVETITESDDADVTAKIQEHVAAMQGRMKSGSGLRFWDPLFVALFDNYEQIEMTVENTDQGVKVIEISKNPFAAKLIQAHAAVVTKFVEHGFEEAEKSHEVPKTEPVPATDSANSSLQFPVIEGFGGVVAIADAVDPLRSGMKLVLDVTADTKGPEEVSKGLDRAARVLNLYGVSGMLASDVKITVILHGEATKSVLTDAAWESRFHVGKNPNLPLVESLQKAGVEVLVCGQALGYKKIDRSEVAASVPVAAAAFSVLMNRQVDGYSYLPVQ